MGTKAKPFCKMAVMYFSLIGLFLIGIPTPIFSDAGNADLTCDQQSPVLSCKATDEDGIFHVVIYDDKGTEEEKIVGDCEKEVKFTIPLKESIKHKHLIEIVDCQKGVPSTEWFTIDKVGGVSGPRASSASLFPDWFTQNMNWYLDGMITEQELANGFEHLININVIFLDPERAQEMQDLRDENKRLKDLLDDLDKSFQQLKSEPTTDELLALFLKLNINDPNNSPEVHNLMIELYSMLSKQGIKSSQLKADIARELLEQAQEQAATRQLPPMEQEEAQSEVPSTGDAEPEEEYQGAQSEVPSLNDFYVEQAQQASEPEREAQEASEPSTQPDSTPTETCTSAVFERDLPISFSKGDRVMFKVNFGKQFDSISQINLKSSFSPKNPFDEGDQYFVDNLGGQRAGTYSSGTTSTISIIDPTTTEQLLDGEYVGWFVDENGSFTMDSGGMEVCVQEPNECECESVGIYPTKILKDDLGMSVFGGIREYSDKPEFTGEYMILLQIIYTKWIVCEEVTKYADKCTGYITPDWLVNSVKVDGVETIKPYKTNNKPLEDPFMQPKKITCEDECDGKAKYSELEVLFHSGTLAKFADEESYKKSEIKVEITLMHKAHCDDGNGAEGDWKMTLKLFKAAGSDKTVLDKSNSDYDGDGYGNLEEHRAGSYPYTPHSTPKNK